MIEENFVEVPCILCGGNNVQLIGDEGQYGIPVNVVLCRNDGLVYLNPRWTKERYNQFYTVEYDRYYRKDMSKSKAIQLYRAQFTLDKLPDQTGKRILDIGAGYGNTLDVFGNIKGVTLAAIEASDGGNKKMQEKGIDVIARDVELEDWHLSREGEFDLVILSHVLEHLLDPIGTLKKIAHVLSSEGILQIEIPNMMEPAGSLEKFYFRAVHTYYFSTATLVQAAKMAGLEIVDIDESEVTWATFKRASGKLDLNFKSIYAEQKKAIIRHRKEYVSKNSFSGEYALRKGHKEHGIMDL